MSRSCRLPILLTLIAGIGGATLAVADTPATTRAPLYYQDPSGKPDYSPTPKTDPGGRAYVPVYDESEAPPPAEPASKPGKILYYRNPMGLPDTSPVPKKDSMGMDYLPVYADEAAEAAAGTVRISPDKVQKLGVRTEEVASRPLTRTIRAVGTIAADERGQSVIAPRYEGWIEKLLVNTTGQAVRKGQPLFEVYSPDLLLAEQEYVVAREGQSGVANADRATQANAAMIARAALTRLRNWDVPADEIARLQRDGTPGRTLTLRAPRAGLVLEKTAVEGLHFAPGDMLFRIADLSTVWLIADVFEQDLALVQPGQRATITVAAYPDRSFTGVVAFIYPNVNRETRTARVRVEIPNSDSVLKTEMYATVELAAPVAAASVLAVPASAVLDGGTRQVVLVERGAGQYEPREVKLGARAGGYVAVAGGVRAGERVVTGANFLIDAESNLRSALQAFTAPAPEKTP